MKTETKEDKFYRIAKAFYDKFVEKTYGEIDYGVDANNTEQLVVVTDWNKIDNSDKWEKLFESLGAEIWWSDQYGRCDHCSNLIDMQPIHYGWEPDYIITEYSYICRECIETNSDDVEDWFEDYIYNYHNGCHHPAKAIPSWAIKLFEKQGWQCWSEDNEDLCHRYESGWYPGQNDDPVRNFNDIMSVDTNLQVVFAIDNVGQFDVHWHILVKPKIED